MDERPTLDYGTDAPAKPREPRWRRVTTATLLTLFTLPWLIAGIAGWYQQVFGDADVGGGCVWVTLIIAFGLTWGTAKHWLAVRD